MAVSMNRYDQWPEYFGDNTADLDADAFHLVLLDSVHAFDATDTVHADIAANQLSTEFGYVQATGGLTGKAIASVTWVNTAGTIKFDGADITWTASGGSIGPADDCVIFDDTTTAVTDALAYSIDFDGSETAGDGTDFKITWNGSGIFTVA